MTPDRFKQFQIETDCFFLMFDRPQSGEQFISAGKNAVGCLGIFLLGACEDFGFSFIGQHNLEIDQAHSTMICSLQETSRPRNMEESQV